MRSIYWFGEQVAGYTIPVLNEREVRAGTWILFLFALISFMHARLVNYMGFISLFISFFLLDFSIRLFVSPRFSPILILWRLAVRQQTPEYTWAAQKRFAWLIWRILAIFMFFWVVVYGMTGIINMTICFICLSLLFLEAGFGICLWCKIYNLFHSKKAELCPGWACSIRSLAPIQRISPTQIIICIVFLLVLIFSLFYFL